MKMISFLIVSIFLLQQGHVDASINRLLPNIPYNTISCEGTEVNIECPVGYHIQLLHGYFGRTDPEECIAEGENPADPSELPCADTQIFDIPKVMACDGTQSCPLTISTEELGVNPCPTSSFKKYLNISYECVKDIVDQFVCEHETIALSCPDGEVIQVVDVLYGRTDNIRCTQDETENTECYSADAGYILTDLCNHKQYCEVEASARVFGEPCEGTSKILDVRYQCALCVNTYEDSATCDEYAMNGECEANPVWMMSWCRMSCWRCDTTVSCGDVSDYNDCTKWASIGECRNNEDWMRENCQYSCNKCHENTFDQNEVVNDNWQQEEQQQEVRQEEFVQEEVKHEEEAEPRVRRSNRSEKSKKYDDLPLKRYYSVIAIGLTIFALIFMLIWRTCRQKERGSTFKKSA